MRIEIVHVPEWGAPKDPAEHITNILGFRHDSVQIRAHVIGTLATAVFLEVIFHDVAEVLSAANRWGAFLEMVVTA